MKNPQLEALRKTLRKLWYRQHGKAKANYTCPICNYVGPFKDKSVRGNRAATRSDSKCLGCGSNERHRLIHLVMEDLNKREDLSNKSILHIAPEACLGKQLASMFGNYETADLFKEDVDHKEDLQDMSFEKESYDWIVISRVLTEPPNLDSCLNEIRRVLKPGGVAVIAETYTEEKTVEHGEVLKERARIIGIDLLDKLENRFSSLETYKGSRFPQEYQLANRMLLNSQPHDDYPEAVKVPGIGFTDMVVICRV